MAYLTDAMRQKIWRGLMRWWSNLREPMAITKTSLKVAVDATDTWIDDNLVSYNGALPEPAKSQLTASQKTLLFCAVALARNSEDILRRLFGEVD